MLKEEEVLIKFANNLKELRLTKSLSQERLALENDFDRTYISLLERGKRNPSLKTIWKLAQYLGVKVSELLEGI